VCITTRARWWVILSVVIIFVLAASLLVRPTLAIYWQNQAGGLIAQQLGSNTAMFPCEIPPLTDPNERSRIQTAMALLDRSIQYEPRFSQSYLLLGHAACLIGQTERAVEAFQTYARLRPNNPLGYVELGFARYNLCSDRTEKSARDVSSLSEIRLCQDTELLHQIRSDWLAHGIDVNQFLTSARQAFENLQYADADLWYLRAAKFELTSIKDMPTPDQYKWAVAAIRSHSSFPQALARLLPIHDLDRSSTILAGELHLFRENPNHTLNYGDPVASKSVDHHTAGIMYYGGQAGVFIDVKQDGWYQISIQAQNTPPAPVILLVESDFQPFGKIELTRGDGSWQVFQFKVNLQANMHLLDINYINDGMVNDVDRNAVIEWIKIEKKG
jgi:tetratricopeptide (TPR) repeat protein